MRIVQRTLAFILLCLLLTAAPAWAFFSLSDTKNAMVDFLLSQLSTEGVFEITAEEVTELDDGSTAITGLQIADAEGVWFTAEALSFQWNPRRLLRGEVEFNALVMSGVKIARRPIDPPSVDIKEETGPPEADSPFAWPRSPLTLRIDRMALERVEIAEPVLGHAIAFDAEGSARDEGDIQAVSLKITRTDRIAGTIDFAYTRNFGDDTLHVDLKADEAAGGLIPHLAGLPQDAASALTVTADGPPSDWRAVFDLDLAETIAAQGKAAISYEGPLKVDTAFTARPGPQLAPDLAALLGERAELVARISQQPDGSIEIAEGRLESPEMKLSASGTFAPTTGTSDLKISFNAGGRLAEPIEGVDFRLARFDGHVTGPVGAIHAAGDLRLEGLRTAPADVETAVLKIDVRADEGTGQRLIVLDVSGSTTGLRIDRLGTDVLGDARVEVKGRLLGQALTLEVASLDSKALTISATGTGNLDPRSFDMDFELAAPDLAPVAGAYEMPAEGSIRLAGQFRQRGEDIRLTAGAELRDFAHPMAAARRLRLDGSVEKSGETVRLDLKGNGEALRLDKIGPDVLGDPTLAVKGTLKGDALTLETATLDSKVLTLTARGTGDLAASEFDIDLELSAPELAAMARAYGVEASGSIGLKGNVRQSGATIKATATTELAGFSHPSADAKRLQLDGSVEIAGDRIGFDVRGRGEALRLDRIDAELLPQATLAARGTLDGDRLTLQTFDLASPVLTAKGSGEIALETTAGRISYDVGLPDLAVIARRYDVPLAGALAMRGAATLPTARAPRLDGRIAIDGLAYDGTEYGRLALTHDVEVSETPAGKIGIRLRESPYGDVGLDTGFAYTAPRLTLSGLRAEALGLVAAGDLAVRTDGPLADGTLKVTAKSLAPAGKLAGTPVAGNGWGTVTLSTEDGRQNADVTLDLRGLAFGNTRIGAADIVARLRDVLGQPAIDTRLRLTGIEAGDIELGAARLTARGPLSGLAINAETSGTLLDKPLSARLDASVSAGGPTTTARVTRLEATLAEERVGLTAPLLITASDGVTRVTGLDLALPDSGRVTGDLTITGRPVAGNLTVRLPRLDFLKRFAEIPVKNGSVEANLTFDRRGGNGAFTASGLEFDDVDAPGAITIAGRADWAGRRLALEATAEGGFGEPVRATARLPLAHAGGLPQPAGRGPLEARIAWQGEMGELWALVPAPGHVLTGKTVIDLGVGGDISNPQLSGKIAVSDGSYQNLDLGTILTDLTLATELLGRGDLGINLAARDGAAGRVTVTGRVALDASGIDLTTRIDRAVLVRRDDVTARIDGDIAIKGPATALDVTGTLEIQEAEVRLVNSAAPSIVTLGDVRIKGEKPKRKREKSSGVNLDLTIGSSDRIFVRGRGLDSQWGLDLRVTGDAAAPVITGAVEKVRGRLNLIGKDFELERGTVRFDGGRKIDPRIDVALTRTTSDLTGGIVVSGSASDPELNFTSTPNLPDDEVMPRLLFGKSRQALTGSQAIQLSLGLATLMNGGGGTLDKVRSTVGLDQLGISEDENGNASVRLGEEVTEGVFVGTETALDGSGTSVTVEIDVFKDFKVDTEIGPDGETSVGVQWKKDF